MPRLIVTDSPEAARALAQRFAERPAVRAAHGLEFYEWDENGQTTRLLGIDGLLFTPHGNPPEWRPHRRAAARALDALAARSDELVLSCHDPLAAAQARDSACAGRPVLARSVRVGDPPWDRLFHLDELAAEARAAELEIDAVFSDFLTNVDPHLTRDDLVTLVRVGGGAMSRATLLAQGATEESLTRLAERGYLVGDPAWRSPAAVLLLAATPAPLRDPVVVGRCALWIDAVRRGTLTRPTATRRATTLVAELTPPRRPDGFDSGRLMGVCPSCGDWMGGAREMLRCMGCGLTFHQGRGVELLAVPGTTCSACSAPLVRPVVRGSVGAPRCADRLGCPTALEPRLA